MNELVTKTIILNQGDPEAKRQEIMEYFRRTIQIEAELFRTFRREGTYYLRADPLRHPLIFYYGHTAVFYINKLILAKILDQRINPGYESMFAVGVDEMSWDDLNEAHYDWPTVAEVSEYRQQVWQKVEEVISKLPLTIPITWKEPFWVIMMGIEHQRIHLETSSVLIRQLPLAELRQTDFWKYCRESGTAPENELVPVPGGEVNLGKEKSHPLYGWDNEFGSYREEVPDFQAARYLVSNQEFRCFVEAGGYRKSEFWTEEGWEWRNYRQAEYPLFWLKQADDSFRLRLMLTTIPLPWDWPVEVNYLEAKAFCNWQASQTGKPVRLPAEAEWHRLRDHALQDMDQPYWLQAPGNINLEYYASSCPVNKFAQGAFYDVIGNVWQWTETPINGFPGFAVHPFYDDFSTPTFDGRHNLIKGGSWISTGNEATRDARYAFRRHFFQHAGFRYIVSSAPVKISPEPYESDPDVSLRCEFNYGREYLGVSNFSRQAAELCFRFNEGRKFTRALNLGCDTGRTAFELAGKFQQVTGLEFTARYIRIAQQLKDTGSIRYQLPEEGELVSFHEHSLRELSLEDNAARVDFWQADASNLKTIFRDYDLVYVQNILDRVYDPASLLERITGIVLPGGLLVISSVHDWQTDFTTREKWLGGVRKDGEPYTTLEGLREHLSPCFKLIADPVDIPLIKRLTARKLQYGIAEFTVWEKAGNREDQ